MKKIAVVTDSNCGLGREEAEKLGISVIPMPFTIGDEEFFEGVNITQEEFYRRIAGGDEKVSTSQPSVTSVTGLWDSLLKTHDQVVHIPMSSGLSGSCQTARMLAEDYGGRVEVVNDRRISVTLVRACMDALELIRAGYDAKAVRKKLEETGPESSIYIMLDTLEYLKRGGRITPAAAAIGTILRLKPVLQIQGEKLDAFSKARTPAHGRKIMIQAAARDIEERFGSLAARDVWIDMAYTGDPASPGLAEFRKEVEEAFPWAEGLRMDPLSLSVGCHIGPGAAAVAVTRRLHL